MGNARPERKLDAWQILLIVVLLPLVLSIVLLQLILYLVWSVCLHAVIWSWWCLRGRGVLFVYSDSPVWRDYIEQHILPRLDERAVVLNWSQRKRWRFSLARLAFYHFGGSQEFNPLAVVFRPLRPTRIFRFWQSFRDLKHGRPEALHEVETEFLRLIEGQRRGVSA
jgi:hypothetical protein